MKRKYRFWWGAMNKMYSWEEARVLNIWLCFDRADEEDNGLIAKPLQWTGRTDTNGVEIYEGDLIEYHGDKAEVVLEDDRFITVPKGIFAQPVGLHGLSGKDIKVIGNIYEKEEENEQTSDA
jgi:hypothetical protein